MKIPRYLSPTQLQTWLRSPEEYYLMYLADTPPPRMPQTQAMSIGSAFDAFVKSFLMQELYGRIEPDFEITRIFESQVEEQHREWAWEHGRKLFNAYKESGALADLMLEFSGVELPRFELTVQKTLDGIPILGKPDLCFKTKTGVPIIIDWKVNGYCSTNPTSPKAGYVRLRPDNCMHRDCMPMEIDGITINASRYLENVDKTWAIQLATYGWLMGCSVGSVFISGIEQIVRGPQNLRFAAHRCLISQEFQETTWAHYQDMWKIINSDHIFRMLTKEESQRKCELLNKQHLAYTGQHGEWLAKAVRKHDY